ncbi:MAG TPA: hypothetical protein V6C81_00850 [Planktothrix sp.]|jgi:predicted thioesterase
MKPGLKIGDSAEVEIVVTEDMVAGFGGQVIHRLYCTSALVQHMEWAARKVLEPYFEAHEEGVGCNVECSHLALTLPGCTVKVKATLTEIRERKIVCEVEAFNARGKIARGSVTQSIIEREWLAEKMNELALITQLSSQAEASSKAQ